MSRISPDLPGGLRDNNNHLGKICSNVCLRVLLRRVDLLCLTLPHPLAHLTLLRLLHHLLHHHHQLPLPLRLNLQTHRLG
jgi:hypothetical protein